jgi:hypothetical protein
MALASGCCREPLIDSRIIGPACGGDASRL